MKRAERGLLLPAVALGLLAQPEASCCLGTAELLSQWQSVSCEARLMMGALSELEQMSGGNQC